MRYFHVAAIVLGVLARARVAAQDFDWTGGIPLPAGVSEDHVAAQFDFSEGVGGWAAASTDGMGVEATRVAEGLRLRLTRSHGRPAWIESPPMNLSTIDSTFVVVRMRHLTPARVANLTLDFDPAASQRRNSLPDWQLRGQETRAIALFADGQYHEYAFPVFLAREVVPAKVAVVTRLRLYPFYDAPGAGGTVLIAWIRVIHAPTIVRVTGCVRPLATAAASSPYAVGSGAGGPIPPHRLFVREGAGSDRFFAHDEEAITGANATGNVSLPFAATLGCSPAGGDRITIQGRHIGGVAPGARLPLVAIDGRPCTDVVVEHPQTQVSCTTPPGAGLFVPVVVSSPDAPVVADAELLLSYAPEPTPPRVIFANVAARAVDVVVTLQDTFVAAATTGYRLQWRASQWAPGGSRDGVGAGVQGVSASQTRSRRVWGHWGDPSTGGGQATVGNLTVITVRGLRANTAYQFRAACFTTLVGATNAWLQTDMYGHVLPAAEPGGGWQARGGVAAPLAYVLAHGVHGPFSDPAEIATLPFDFLFSHFDANATLDHGPAWPGAVRNTLQRAGGSGAFGLSLLGSASVGNCNASHVCCDSFGGPGFANRMARLFAVDDADPAHVPRTDTGGTDSLYQYSDSSFDFSPVPWASPDANAAEFGGDATDATTPAVAMEQARNRIAVDGGLSPSAAAADVAAAAGLDSSRYRLGEPNDVAWSPADPFSALLAYGSNRHPAARALHRLHQPVGLWEGYDDASNVAFVPLSAIAAAEARAVAEHERNVSAADYFFGLDRGDASDAGAVRPRRRGVFYDSAGRRMVPASVHPASLCTLTCTMAPGAAGGPAHFNLQARAGSAAFAQGLDAGPTAPGDSGSGAGMAGMAGVAGGAFPGATGELSSASGFDAEADRRGGFDAAAWAAAVGNGYVSGRLLRRQRGVGFDRNGSAVGDATGRLPFADPALASDEPGMGSGAASLSPREATLLSGLVITNVASSDGRPSPVPIDAPFPPPPAAGAYGAASAETATAPCGPALRLTGAHPDQAGAAWYGRQLQVREGFDTAFAFRISQPDPSSACRTNAGAHTHCRARGGGGFAFVVHNWHPGALGLGGTDGLGYAGIRNSVAVEFDTHFDTPADATPLHEPYENHVSVQTRGFAAGNSPNHTYSLGHAAGAGLPDLTEGIHLARVVYTPRFEASALSHPAFAGAGNPYLADLLGYSGQATAAGALLQRRGFGLLYVYVDSATEPLLIVPMNLAALLDIAPTHGRAWVGFTASTGAGVWQVHDMLAWHLTELRVDP